MSSPTETTTPTRPVSAPDGAESLPGVIDIYAAYDATKAVADAPGATKEQIDAYDAAAVELRNSRMYWRQIREAVQAIAVAEWEAAQQEGEA